MFFVSKYYSWCLDTMSSFAVRKSQFVGVGHVLLDLFTYLQNYIFKYHFWNISSNSMFLLDMYTYNYVVFLISPSMMGIRCRTFFPIFWDVFIYGFNGYYCYSYWVWVCYSYLAHCFPRILQRSASVVKRWAKYLGE